MRKLTAIVLSLIFLVSLTLSASAAVAGTFLLKEYDVAADSIYCYGKQLPAGGTLTVSTGSQVVENAVFSTLEQENVPVTIYCLVDSSTSRSDSMKQQQEDMLLTFSSLMSERDNMVLGLLDAALVEGKPMSDKTARDTAITTIAGQSWYTNLYDGMLQAVESLYTSTAYHTNRCLVVIGDGHDDGKSVAASDKVLKQIQEAGIPVYSVILDEATVTQKELTYHEQFAEESLGGYLCIPDEEGISASVAAQRIWESIKGGSAISIGMEELQNRETDQQLLIRYDAGDTRYEDTILIRAVDLQASLETPEETASEEETEPAEGGEDEKEFPLVMLVAGGIGAALLVACIAAFVLLRKKPAPEENAVSPYTPPVEEASDMSFNFATDNTQPVMPVDLEQTAPVVGRCHVFAVGIMHPEIAADFYLTPNMETTFGRTDRADIILCEKDTKLSGVHGCFYWDGKMLLVCDRKSKNGTAVNGENCYDKVWLRLEEGAVLRAGSYEYRINFRVEDKY